MTQLFEHRFAGGEGLAGHSFGNVFIAALTQLTGSFERAVGGPDVLATRGRILPSTLEDVTLCAELADSTTVRGESQIPVAARAPAHRAASPASASIRPIRPLTRRCCALLEADLIVLGPGSSTPASCPTSWYRTRPGPSVLGTRKLCKLYVCNVATQPGETDGYDVRAFVRALIDHVSARLDVPQERSTPASGRSATSWSTRTSPPTSPPRRGHPPRAGLRRRCLAGGPRRRPRPRRRRAGRDPTRHDPHKLARAILDCHAAWQQARSARRPVPFSAPPGRPGARGP